MTSIALHPLPGTDAVAREQLRAARQQLLPFLAALGILWILYDTWMILLAWHWGRLEEQHLAHSTINIGFAVEETIIVSVFALLMAIIAWIDEDPSKRTYHWTMPLRRETHALLKVAAAWAWTMVAAAAFLVNTVAVAAITARLQHLPALHGEVGMPMWHYLVPFTGATVVFLLVSAACVASKRPIVWVGGIPVALIGVITLAMFYGQRSVAFFLRDLGTARYGLFTVLGYGVRDGMNDYANVVIHDGGTRWVLATLLWGAIGAALFVFAARRRVEVR